MEIYSLVSLVLLILVIWAIVITVQSSLPTSHKVLWIVLLIILPVIGLIFWFFMGPRKKCAKVEPPSQPTDTGPSQDSSNHDTHHDEHKY